MTLKLGLFLVGLLPLFANANDCINRYNSRGELLQKFNPSKCSSSVKWILESENGKKKNFVLNDPAEDDKNLLSSPPDDINVVNSKEIKSSTAHVEDNTVFDLRSLKMLYERSWGDLDYAKKLPENSLIDGVLYGSTYDSGNFLWGYSAARLGTSLAMALAGAHFNSLTNSWYKKKGWNGLDSEGDQRAIKAGWKYFYKHCSSRQRLLKALDLIIP